MHQDARAVDATWTLNFVLTVLARVVSFDGMG